ncbi:MAG: RNA polymerase-associated protein RapA [Halieaceae bacterium]|jgi:ATP-dependent helicase HepA|nr:RNA polymerase-associated protein RapA [Halieaceae bacterium]
MSSLDYIVGQRWVSHADAQLGLGIVADIEGRRVTVSFPAIGEERTYAIDNAPLTRLRFKVGDYITTLDDVELKVTEVVEQSGILFYTGLDHHDKSVTISELELDSFVQLTTPQQRLLNGHFDRNSDFALRLATFEQLDRLQTSPARGLIGSRTSLLPHQVYIAAEVGRRHAPRVLLADEVGLGKTIEAGMITQQQLLSGRASRVLVIVPETLMHQWLVEMLRRFNLRFALFDEERLAAMQETAPDLPGLDFEEDLAAVAAAGPDNPFEAEQLVLASLDLFTDNPERREQALAAGWDLVVLDEAHHLSWSPEEAGEDYRFIEALAQRSAGLLLLTATPEQVGQASHFARLRLLDPDRFHDLAAFQAEERGYQALNSTLEQLEAEGADAAEIARLLDRHGTGRVLFRNTRASVTGFPQRHFHPYPLDAPDADHGGDLLRALYPERGSDNENWVNTDPRVAWLEQTLKTLRPEKVLVICAHADTAIALEHYLHLRAGIRSAAFYEGLTILERDRAAAYFADPEGGAQTLVCSEIGSEGRNFQFARHVVLFDLPLNPDLLEQRIGRLDRIGQQHDVEIHLPFLAGTAQETLMRWYHEGLNQFEQSCSAGYAIYQRFRERLTALLLAPDAPALAALIADTAAFTAETRAELREGRDKLLERNSCKHDEAEALIASIREAEASDTLRDYLEQLCDSFGVETEFHSEHALVLRPTDHMLTGHFPGLQEEGTTVTFSREQALAREDMQFLTWEHPIAVEAMEMVTSTELGNAAIATLSLKGVPPATLLLESLYCINCVAPRELGVERFLPVSPIRLLVDSRGKDLSAIMPHARLNELCEKVKKPVALQIIKQVRSQVEDKMQFAARLAEQQREDILAQAEANMRSELGAELARLKALREVNPSIRSDEITHLQHRIEECAAHISHANLQMQGLRLIVTT